MEIAEGLRLDTADGKRALWEFIRGQRKAGALADGPEMLFLGMCLAHYGHSWSQVFQDLYVLWRLRQKRQGYFVEFGATDGLSISNTALLERDFGWTGILAEPNPHWHEALGANRRAIVDHRAVSGRSGNRVAFRARKDHPELSGIGGPAGDGIEVETVSLLDLLRQHKAPAVIDYLSLDTEGNELDILLAFDFSFRFRVITVEHNHDAVAREGIRTLLTGRGYRREFEIFSAQDDWYFHPDLVR